MQHCCQSQPRSKGSALTDPRSSRRSVQPHRRLAGFSPVFTAAHSGEHHRKWTRRSLWALFGPWLSCKRQVLSTGAMDVPWVPVVHSRYVCCHPAARKAHRCWFPQVSGHFTWPAAISTHCRTSPAAIYPIRPCMSSHSLSHPHYDMFRLGRQDGSAADLVRP